MLHNLYTNSLVVGHLGRLLFLADFCCCRIPSRVGWDGKGKIIPGQAKIGYWGACGHDAKIEFMEQK